MSEQLAELRRLAEIARVEMEAAWKAAEEASRRAHKQRVIYEATLNRPLGTDWVSTAEERAALAPVAPIY